jgi:hypothetical protein
MLHPYGFTKTDTENPKDVRGTTNAIAYKSYSKRTTDEA